MRFVKKGAEPAALRAFKANNKTTPEVLVYSSLSAGVRSALYRSMLAEQGKLCAYTMMPIGRHLGNAPRDFHIEHVQPRWCHRERELDYNNMVLCALGDNRAGGEFGARKKDDADVNDADFVAPLNASCETRLRFESRGYVDPSDANDKAAVRTIKLLALDHPALREARSGAIAAQGLGPLARKPISAGEALRLATEIMKANAKGEIAPFCVAVKQVAERFSQQSKAHSARVKGAAGRQS